jgi:maltooligosyltrehalose trehalohydrolase
MKLQKPPFREALKRRYPIGAEVGAKGTHFRVWAPDCKQVELILEASGETRAMLSEPPGHFSLFADEVGPGTTYRFLLDRRGPFPDPASRFQPDGPHGPSEVIDPHAFSWSDQQWGGIDARNQVQYELHLGTFTPVGTWLAAIEQLPALVETGITVLEVMPVADFPGSFGWGYDGVDLFAPTRLYGRPDDFRRFVDRAHALGLGVILDVVYNHVGPDGNYLTEFSPSYFSSRYENEWGEPINFDQDASGVREFFIANAGYWIDEFHLDGLRLDATQQIFDASPRHILHDVAVAVRRAASTRSTYIVAENERQDVELIRKHALDAMWNDDFHHSAIVALTGRREAYYSDHHGTPQEFVSAAKHGFLFQGQRYAWQEQPRGKPALDLGPHNFVHFLENHDQVANSSSGQRLQHSCAPGQLRAMTALLLLGPQTPLLFQGQEFGSSKPFLFFADHNPTLAKAVAHGRTEFLAQFPSANAARESLAPPHDPATFERCKLDHAERTKNTHTWELHRDLIALRKADPVFSHSDAVEVDGSVIAPDAFVLRYFSAQHRDRLLIVNLGSDIVAESIADPLVAPQINARWRMVWSSEEVRYGGRGAIDFDNEGVWTIPGHSAIVLAADEA